MQTTTFNPQDHTTMSFETTSLYSHWSAEELAECIARVQAEITALQEKVELRIERRRERKRVKLAMEIEEVKAKIRSYGGEVPEKGSKKRKRGAEDVDEEYEELVKNAKRGERKSLIVKLPITVEYEYEYVDDDEEQDE